MKTIVTHLYSYAELCDAAKQAVVRQIGKERERDIELLAHSSREMLASLEAVCDACGLLLYNYSFGSYRNDSDAEVHGENSDLQGNRALAWFLRILLKHGYTRPAKFADITFPSVCGFTGVCFDENVAETIWKSLLEGATVQGAFYDVAEEFCRMLEREERYLTSEEAILESLDQSAEIYTAEGVEF